MMRVLGETLGFEPEFHFHLPPGGYVNGEWTGSDRMVGYLILYSS